MARNSRAGVLWRQQTPRACTDFTKRWKRIGQPWCCVRAEKYYSTWPRFASGYLNPFAAGRLYRPGKRAIFKKWSRRGQVHCGGEGCRTIKSRFRNFILSTYSINLFYGSDNCSYQAGTMEWHLPMCISAGRFAVHLIDVNGTQLQKHWSPLKKKISTRQRLSKKKPYYYRTRQICWSIASAFPLTFQYRCAAGRYCDKKLLQKMPVKMQLFQKLDVGYATANVPANITASISITKY